MERQILAAVVLTACWTALVGCSPRGEPPVQQTTAQEPSVRYLPADPSANMAPVVVVEGYPLVHTRQVLPLDPQGKLVGEGSAEEQVEQVLANLETVLSAAGSGLGRLVKLHGCADSPHTVDLLREQLRARLDEAVRPAISAVSSPLPQPGALVAVDAVAIADEGNDAVALRTCDGIAGTEGCADAAVMPRGGVVYLSGQPDKSPLPEATVNSLTALLEIVDQLKLERSQVVQLKVFVDSAKEADVVLNELKKLFPDQMLPPVIFVQWIATAPVEIEMIVHLPLSGAPPSETVRFYTPPGVKPSPTFSRVALVQTDRQIYVSGLTARAAGDGEAQVRDVFDQLQQILSETGSDLKHLAKATYYVSDNDASDMLNKLRPEFYAPERPPAASKAMVLGVGQSDRTLLMDMIAVGAER